MNILTPVEITDAKFVSSTISEPDVGETVWVSGGTYVLADQRIRTATHRKYECIQAHSGRATNPENDPLYWEDIGPTNQWAPFDTYVSTAASSTTTLNYVLSPSFINALSAYGLEGESLTVTVKNGPGGSTLFTETYELFEQAIGLYEYLFTPQRSLDRKVVTNLPLHPTAEVTIAVNAASGNKVSVGLINLGTYKTLAQSQSWGGTKKGASVEPVTYSRITTNEFGETVIKRGHRATGMRADVVVPIADATFALRAIQDVLDRPVSWIATELPGYEGLNVFGLGNASMSYEDATHAKLSINVKGLI